MVSDTKRTLVISDFDWGANLRGASKAGEKLKSLGYVGSARQISETLYVKSTSLPSPTDFNINNFESCRLYLESLYDQLCQLYEAGGVPVVIGGDHSVAISSVSAASAYLKRSNQTLGALWIDAHADINPPEESLTRNLHGMVVAILCGEGPEALSGLGGFSPKLRWENIALFGSRDLDSAEKSLIAKHRLEAVYFEDIIAEGLLSSLERALDKLDSRVDKIHVSLMLIASIRPLLRASPLRRKGGFSAEEARLIVSECLRHPKVFAMDIVELNPECDDQDKTAKIVGEILLQVSKTS